MTVPLMYCNTIAPYNLLDIKNSVSSMEMLEERLKDNRLAQLEVRGMEVVNVLSVSRISLVVRRAS